MIFEHTSKNPDSQHIAENVIKTSMQKHISNKLERMKINRMHIMQRQKILDLIGITLAISHLCQKHQPVDDKQIFYYWWKQVVTELIITHLTKIG